MLLKVFTTFVESFDVEKVKKLMKIVDSNDELLKNMQILTRLRQFKKQKGGRFYASMRQVFGKKMEISLKKVLKKLNENNKNNENDGGGHDELLSSKKRVNDATGDENCSKKTKIE